ncbi:MAG TPA: response regulator [Patescibacteria group bacterium]|nr:response regulator [Patescibacteria group bacterium]
MSIHINDQDRELAPGIYWVGDPEHADNLYCNPYLILDGEEAVLIDPGSPLDFAGVLANVTRLISLDRIKYIILQHQDPDFCASTPQFEQQGFKGSLATHWRAAQLIKFYGVTSPFYIVNEHHLQLSFGTGRTLQFLPTPYLHFPGAITTYDPASKILFSSDLFGAFSPHWTLFADEQEDLGLSYKEAMLAFHEHYMPGSDILHPVMESFLNLDISIIAPQHGSIIRRQVKTYIQALSTLECGTFLTPIKKDLSRIDGYTGLLNRVLQRYYALYPKEEVVATFAETMIHLNPEDGLIADYTCTGRELWQQFFQFIYSKNGISWLISVEPLILHFVADYELELPKIFQSALLSLEKTQQELHEENKLLREDKRSLEENLQQVEDSLLKCPLTHLHNEVFFMRYLNAECRAFHQGQSAGSLVAISPDSMAHINQHFGGTAGNEVLKTAALLLEENLDAQHSLFRLEGPVFAIHLPGVDKATAAAYAEQLRYLFQQSERFIEPITVSAAVVAFSGFSPAAGENADLLSAAVYKTLRSRLQEARLRGGNTLCIDGEPAKPVLGKVLLADSDRAHLQILQQALEDANVTVLTTADGQAALSLVLRELPDLIISELLLPKMDGFLLRERLRQDSETDQIPFFLVSFLKDQESIQRALTLEIEHYLRKPYLVTELTGLILLKLRRKSR